MGPKGRASRKTLRRMGPRPGNRARQRDGDLMLAGDRSSGREWRRRQLESRTRTFWVMPTAGFGMVSMTAVWQRKERNMLSSVTDSSHSSRRGKRQWSKRRRRVFWECLKGILAWILKWIPKEFLRWILLVLLRFFLDIFFGD